LSQLVRGPFQAQDLHLAAMGVRAAAADIAWVQLLQYAGGEPAPTEGPGRRYNMLKDMTLRVVRLDSRFQRAYAFGAAMLAWDTEVQRPDEALDILQEGIRNNPDYGLLRLMVAALAYKKQGDVPRMMGILESSLDDPACPLLMKAILANIHKERGEYAAALAVWENMLASGYDDASYRERAHRQIDDIHRLSASPDMVGPDAIWPATKAVLDKFDAQCRRMSIPDTGHCLVDFMAGAGAKPAALAFTRRLEGAGYLRALECHGRVSVAYVTYPFRANSNEGVLLVNGRPPLVDVSDPDRMKDFWQDARLKAIRSRNPEAEIWASDPGRPKVARRKGGGWRFVFMFPVRTCRACADLARLNAAFDFDARGGVLGIFLDGVSGTASTSSAKP